MSFPRYPTYKDSGVEWLGEVPVHWDIAHLKRVAKIRYGIGEPPRYHEEGTPLVRATNLHAGKLFDEGMVYVDPSEIPSQRIVWLDAGDIIVVRSGAYTGDSAIIPEGFGPCIAGFDMVLRCHAADPAFVQFALLSSYLKEGQIDLERMRAAQPHLNAEELGSCVVVLPSSPEQRSIVTFLDRETAKIDDLIAEKERLMRLLKEKRQAVISHAVTKGLNPDAPMNPSGVEWLGEVPAHWEIVTLSRVTADRCDGPFGSGLKSEHYTDAGVRVIRLQNIKRDGFNDGDAAFIDPEYCAESLGGHDVISGDLLIAGLGDDNHTVGRACVAPVGIGPAIVKADCFRFRLRTDRAVPEFVAYQLCSGAEADAGVLSTGTTRSRIPLSVMAGRRVALPCTVEQAEIVDFIRGEKARVDGLLTEAERGIDLLQERRTALISAAVTGQIDVRALAHPAAA